MSERGVALVLALMALLLLSALGLALVLTTSAESMIASNHRNAVEGLYAADAAAEQAIGELPGSDWAALLDGSAISSFTDGPAAGVRTLADGSALDLTQVVASARAGAAGDNNPAWRLYVWGPVASLLPSGRIDSAFYVVVLAANRPFESNVLWLRSEAFGPRGAHQIVELAVARSGDGSGADPVVFRVLSWRDVR